MSQFCANPSHEHLNRALYIVRYLGSTKNLALRFNGANHDGFLGYTDSDWAANPDDRKSITGYVLFLANSPVSWLTRRQKTVALSSTEAEYMAMSDTTRQISWIKSLLGEIGFLYQKFRFTVITRERSFWQPILLKNNDLNTLEYVTTTSENVWKKETR